MILTEQGVLHYLLYRGLLKAEDAVSDKTHIKKSFSRNRNFLVTSVNQKGFFLKQTSTSSAEKQLTLRNEANCYWLANNDPQFSPLLPILCKYYDYNPQYHILILESIGGINVFEYINQNKKISTEIAASMADSISVVHHITAVKIENAPSKKLFSKFVPWILKIENDNQSVFNITTSATKEVFDIVKQHSNYVDLIKQCREQWQTKSLIHGDIKFPNFFITDKSQSMLKLVDFEICDVGDPCWDVAGVLQAYLTWWIDFANAENIILEQQKESVNKFWNTYIQTTYDLFNDKQSLLKKCMEYTAVRMIQTTFEMASAQQQLHQNQIKTLQMSLNILLKPLQAATDLFGIK